MIQHAFADSDGDDVTDEFDLCPTQPETYNGFEDHDGCPDTAPSDKQIIVEKIATPVKVEVKTTTDSIYAWRQNKGCNPTSTEPLKCLLGNQKKYFTASDELSKYCKTKYDFLDGKFYSREKVINFGDSQYVCLVLIDPWDNSKQNRLDLFIYDGNTEEYIGKAKTFDELIPDSLLINKRFIDFSTMFDLHHEQEYKSKIISSQYYKNKNLIVIEIENNSLTTGRILLVYDLRDNKLKTSQEIFPFVGNDSFYKLHEYSYFLNEMGDKLVFTSGKLDTEQSTWGRVYVKNLHDDKITRLSLQEEYGGNKQFTYFPISISNNDLVLMKSDDSLFLRDLKSGKATIFSPPLQIPYLSSKDWNMNKITEDSKIGKIDFIIPWSPFCQQCASEPDEYDFQLYPADLSTDGKYVRFFYSAKVHSDKNLKSYYENKPFLYDVTNQKLFVITPTYQGKTLDSNFVIFASPFKNEIIFNTEKDENLFFKLDLSNIAQNTAGSDSLITDKEIPPWIKNNAGWWSDGKISDDDFTKGIEFLIKNKIVNVKYQGIQDAGVPLGENRLLDLSQYGLKLQIPNDWEYGEDELWKDFGEISFWGGDIVVRFLDPSFIAYEESFVDVTLVTHLGNYSVLEHAKHFSQSHKKTGSNIIHTEHYKIKNLEEIAINGYDAIKGVYSDDKRDYVVYTLATPKFGLSFITQENHLGIKQVLNSIQLIDGIKSEKSKEKTIPPWIKNNAGWWSDGKISDDDFTKGIQYLLEKGIISVE